jgi:hypothetical protein
MPEKFKFESCRLEDVEGRSVRMAGNPLYLIENSKQALWLINGRSPKLHKENETNDISIDSISKLWDNSKDRIYW